MGRTCRCECGPGRVLWMEEQLLVAFGISKLGWSTRDNSIFRPCSDSFGSPSQLWRIYKRLLDSFCHLEQYNIKVRHRPLAQEVFVLCVCMNGVKCASRFTTHKVMRKSNSFEVMAVFLVTFEARVNILFIFKVNVLYPLEWSRGSLEFDIVEDWISEMVNKFWHTATLNIWVRTYHIQLLLLFWNFRLFIKMIFLGNTYL